MLSLTSQYVLRAMVYLVRNTEAWPVTGRHIAEGTGIPRKYLSSILSDLVRRGVLDSSPGRTGGFRLRQPAGEVSLMDLIGPFEHFDRDCSPFGSPDGGDDTPCGAHAKWNRMMEAQRSFLNSTSVSDVATCSTKRKRSATKKKRGERRRIR